jgi:hypothetical protein
MEKLYTISAPYRYYEKPITKVVDDQIGVTMSVTTWKYDDDQKNYNFEAQFPIGQV